MAGDLGEVPDGSDDERERMIPFVQPQYVTGIDFDAGVISVDWDPDF